MGYTQSTGQLAEELACQYLHKQGLKLIEKNYNCKFGEIDLIMRQDETLVFVEVRSRKSNSLVDGAASVDCFKQQKLRRSAEKYLQQKKYHASTPARIDVVAIVHDNDQAAHINWIQNAIEG